MNRLLLAAVAAALPLAACTGPCLELAQKICDCEPTITARDTCNQRATSEQSIVEVTAEDERRCETLIDQCNCNAVGTEQGKIACGLANSPGI